MSDYTYETISPQQGVKRLLAELLETREVDAVLVQAATPWSALPMPHLFTRPEAMERIVPLCPAAPFNAARQAAQVLRESIGKTIALVLKPCEVRALIELSKLNQCVLDDALIISMECRGRVENKIFLERIKEDPNYPDLYQFNEALQKEMTHSCSVCTGTVPDHADITVLTLGTGETGAWFRANTPTASAVLERLSLKLKPVPKDHDATVADHQAGREKLKTAALEEIRETAGSIEGLQQALAGCLNCYNCRNACPVCYCRECVFKTDVFESKPEILIRRADKRGGIKLPQDTTMFHMTRMLHIGHACVECGHCTSVCPMDIPVAKLFSVAAENLQALYDYRPGRDKDKPIPMLAFKNKDGRTHED